MHNITFNSIVTIHNTWSYIQTNITHIKNKIKKHKNITLSDEEFEYSKRVFRSRKSKKDRQYNGLKKKDKQRSTKNTQKTNGRATRTPLTTGVNPCASEG